MCWWYHKDILRYHRLIEWQDMQKRYFCFECGTNVLEEKMENRIAGWFGICKQCNKNNIYSVDCIKESSLIWLVNMISLTESFNLLIVSLSLRWSSNYNIFSLILHRCCVWHRKISIFSISIISLDCWHYDVSNIFELQK